MHAARRNAVHLKEILKQSSRHNGESGNLNPCPPDTKEVPRLWFELPTMLLLNVTARSSAADAVAVTEAWQITPKISTITGYILFHHFLKNKHGGGEALFCLCHEKLCPTSLQVLVPRASRHCGSELPHTTHHAITASIIYCMVYHPPCAATVIHLGCLKDSVHVR